MVEGEDSRVKDKEFDEFTQYFKEKLGDIDGAVSKRIGSLSGEQLHILYGTIMDWKYEEWDVRIRHVILDKYKHESRTIARPTGL